MTLQQHVTAACQDDDWEVRQSTLEWCHALIAHVHWPHLFELDADSLLHHAVSLKFHHRSIALNTLNRPQTPFD